MKYIECTCKPDFMTYGGSDNWITLKAATEEGTQNRGHLNDQNTFVWKKCNTMKVCYICISIVTA